MVRLFASLLALVCVWPLAASAHGPSRQKVTGEGNRRRASGARRGRRPERRPEELQEREGDSPEAGAPAPATPPSGLAAPA